MRTLTPAERRSLRAKAHHLHPFASIGQHGLTDAVLHEIDVALRAHELVKVRTFSDDRAEREGFLARICEVLDAAPVQHLGKLLIVWRPAPETVAVESKSAARGGPGAGGSAKRQRQPVAGGRKSRPAATTDLRRRKAATTTVRHRPKSGAAPATTRGEVSLASARKPRPAPAPGGSRGSASDARRRRKTR